MTDPDLLELTATLADALEAERAEVERLTKGSICEVAATNPSVMEYMRHWEGRAEKAETERDHAKAMLQSCIKGNIALKDKTQEALARLAALKAENQRLREALKVFATSADGRRRKDTTGSVCFEQVHLLKARAALRSTETNHDD